MPVANSILASIFLFSFYNFYKLGHVYLRLALSSLGLTSWDFPSIAKPLFLSAEVTECTILLGLCGPGFNLRGLMHSKQELCQLSCILAFRSWHKCGPVCVTSLVLMHLGGEWVFCYQKHFTDIHSFQL